ncbi:hypothetical protein LINPERPRIM_LOCUS29520 [Linum perenne]
MRGKVRASVEAQGMLESVRDLLRTVSLCAAGNLRQLRRVSMLC